MGWVYATESGNRRKPANNGLQVIMQMKHGAKERKETNTPTRCSRMRSWVTSSFGTAKRGARGLVYAPDGNIFKFNYSRR